MLSSFSVLSVYRKGPILQVSLYGFMSGMSLLLSGNTLNFWLAKLGVSTTTVGLFSCIALPYAFKYVIALVMDRFALSPSQGGGGHKKWLVLSQVMLAILLILLSQIDPRLHLWQTAFVGLGIAMCAVMQDIVLDAHRVRLLTPQDQGPGAAMYTIGYRLGMLFSGAGMIYASVYLAWHWIFLMLAVFYGLIALVSFVYYTEEGQEEKEPRVAPTNGLFHNLFVAPFAHFLSVKNALWVAGFIMIYRLSDYMLVVMLNPFLLHLGFTAQDIATVSKFFGTVMVILGGLASGPLVAHWGLGRSLIWFSVIHMVGHGFFVALYYFGKNIQFLYFITAYEAFTSGLVMTAYISFITSLCKGRYVATQYALMSSGMGLSRVVLPAFSGLIVDVYGWLAFFWMVVVISLGCVLFLWQMPARLRGGHEHNTP